MLSLYLQPDTSRLDRFAVAFGRVLDAPLSGNTPLRRGVEAFGDDYSAFTQARFRSASSRDGMWAEHAPSTRRRRGEGAPILRETDALYRSLFRGTAGSIFELTTTRLRVGTQDRKARFHQHGTRRMPARPFLVRPSSAVLARASASITSGLRQTINALAV